MAAERTLIDIAPVNSVTFTLPELPPSKNRTHTISRPNIHTNVPRIEIKTEWKHWRSKMQKYVRRLDIAPTSFVRMEVWYFYSFFYLNGNLRVFDTPNLIDFTVDTVKLKQTFDDNRIKFLNVGSTDEPDETLWRAVVRLTEVPAERKERR